MARYKGYDDSQTVMIPVSFENQLLPGTLEFARYFAGRTDGLRSVPTTHLMRPRVGCNG